MLKLTKTQTEALKLIAANPNKVVAFNRTRKDMLRINGNTENKMMALGLIEMVDLGTRTYQGYEFTLRAWALTAAGKAAIATESYEDMVARTAREEGKKLGLTDAQVDRMLARMAG